MKKIIFVIFAVFVSCILFSMAKAENEPARVVASDASSVIDTLKAKGDTLIETTLYEFSNEDKITRTVDSVLKFNPYGSMSLTNVRVNGTHYIQQKFRLLNKDDLKHLRGVYYNERVGKPLYIINLSDSDIINMYLSNTGRRVVVPCQTARKNAVQVETLGYSAYYRKRDGDHYGISLQYNSMPISNEPEAGDKFKWFIPSWSKDSIVKRKDYISRKRYINVLYDDKAQGHSRNFKITENCDTIFAYTSNLGAKIFKKTYTVPVYEFDDSYNGQIIKRLCDSISENDLFIQHSITMDRIHTDSKSTIVISGTNLQKLIRNNKLGGVIFNYNKKSPISVENLPQDFLTKFGIVKTNRTVTVVHTNPWNLLWIDANGFISWVRIMPEGYLKVNLLFWNKFLNKDLAEPFMWLIDQ